MSSYTPPPLTMDAACGRSFPPAVTFDNGTFFIQNQWHGPTESRYGDWLAFGGEDAELIAESDTANKVP